jgi:hypothetical protein
LPCAEKLQLLTIYQSAVTKYQAATEDLDLTRGKVSKMEYERLFAACDAARMASESARKALERHRREHDC